MILQQISDIASLHPYPVWKASDAQCALRQLTLAIGSFMSENMNYEPSGYV